MSRTRKLTRLTLQQEAAMRPWAEKWIAIGLRTGETNWEANAEAVRACYRFAGLREVPIIRVSSPLVGALAAPLAANIIAAAHGSSAVGSAVHSAVHSAVRSSVYSAVYSAVDLAVDSAVYSSVYSAVHSAVRSSVYSAVHSAVHSAVDSAVYSSVGSAVHSAVGSSVYSAVDSGVHSAVHSAVGSAVDLAVGLAVHSAVDSGVHSAVDSGVHSAVDSGVHSAVHSAVGSAVGRKIFWHYWLGGQFWSWWPAFSEFLIAECDAPVSDDIRARSRAYAALSETAGHQWMNRDFCMTSARPVRLERDARGQLHSDTGMAIQWPDGWGLWMIHGVRVNEQIVMRPDTITIEQIRVENNAEVRRVMIDRYGEDRYIVDSGMRPVAHDETFGTLYVEPQEAGTPIAKIRVINRSPEPDGTFRHYWLDINPAHYDGDAGRIPQAAVASTWRTADGALAFRSWRDYSPQVET